MKDGWIKIACVTPSLHVADCTYNSQMMADAMHTAANHGAVLVVFPELSITGYTCGDLFFQASLLQGALDALEDLIQATASLHAVGIVGLPVSWKGTLYNCGAVFCQENYWDWFRSRIFPIMGNFTKYGILRPATRQKPGELFRDGTRFSCPFGAQQIFTCSQLPGFSFGVELCEDVWVGDTPSVQMTQMGATIIVNLSCSDEIIGKEAYRRTMLQAKSGSLLCAYAYADAGFGESTQDMVFAGHNLILENGSVVAESPCFPVAFYMEMSMSRSCRQTGGAAIHLLFRKDKQ